MKHGNIRRKVIILTVASIVAASVVSGGVKSAVNKDTVNLGNWVADSTLFSEDFEKNDTGQINGDGWKYSKIPDNVNFTCEEDQGNKYVKIDNPENSGGTFAVNKSLIKDKNKLKLTEDKCVIEFDVRSSISNGNKTLIFTNSNGKKETVRLKFTEGRIFLVTTGKTNISVYKSKPDEDKWVHLKFIVNSYGEVYDAYVDNLTRAEWKAVPFANSDTIETDSKNSGNIGAMQLRVDKGSGTLELDNLKVYDLKSTAADNKPVVGDISKITDELNNSQDIDQNIDTLTKLRQIGKKEIIPDLFTAIHDKDKAVRNVADKILINLNDGDMSSELCKGLYSDNYFVREAAVCKLLKEGMTKESIAKEVLSSLNSGSIEIKESACVMLKELHSDAKAAVPELKNIMMNKNNDMFLRLRALDALWGIDEDSVPLEGWMLGLNPKAESFYQLMNKCQEVLLKSGKNAVPVLTSGLKDCDDETKTRIIVNLGRIGTDAKAAVPELIKNLNSKEWYVKWEAKRALNMIAPDDMAVKNALAKLPSDLKEASVKAAPGATLKNVTLSLKNGRAIIDNGLVNMELVTSGKGFGDVISLKKNNGKNLYVDQGQYWITTGGNIGPKDNSIKGGKTEFKVVEQSSDKVELSFKVPASDDSPFIKDIRYVLKKGDSGYYYYAILDKSPVYPHPYLGSVETKMRVDYNKFNYRINDERLQGQLDTEDAIAKSHKDEITNETYRMPDGHIWAKYDWESYDIPTEDIGLLDNDTGIWCLFPAKDSGGTYPCYQMGNAREHIIITNLDYELFGGEKRPLEGTRVLGPYYMYINSGKNHTEMRVDANKKTEELKAQWPFSWMTTKGYVKNRGEVTGKLTVSNGFSPKGGYAVLCNPDANNDVRWQASLGPYQYFTRIKDDGSFSIPKVAPGVYTLYSFVDGVYGEVKKENINVMPGKALNVGNITLTPKANGKLVWQVGTPNRTGAEFRGGADPRVYGSIDRYREFFPKDVNFTIGKSKESQDFYYVQPVIASDGTRPVWKINFNMNVIPKGDAILTLGIGSSRDANLHVKMNDKEIGTLYFPYDQERGAVFRGSDYGNSYARELRFDTSILKQGANTLTLSTDNGGNLQYVMYDFIRLETTNKLGIKAFRDIKNNYAKNAIEDLTSQGIMQGKTSTQFDPDGTISRKEFVESLIKVIGLSSIRYENCFADIKGNEEYAGAVQAAFDKDLIDFGMTPGNKFNGNAPMNREEAVSMISKAYYYRLYKGLDSSSINKFSDSSSISKWAVPYIKAANAAGLISGKTDNLFAPKEDITRSEAAIMLERMVQKFPYITH